MSFNSREAVARQLALEGLAFFDNHSDADMPDAEVAEEFIIVREALVDLQALLPDEEEWEGDEGNVTDQEALDDGSD